MPGANEPFGLVAYQITISPQPNNTYLDNEFNAQIGKYILLELQGNKLAVALVYSVQIIDAGLPTATAVFTVIAASMSTQGPRSDITEIPWP